MVIGKKAMEKETEQRGHSNDRDREKTRNEKYCTVYMSMETDDRVKTMKRKVQDISANQCLHIILFKRTILYISVKSDK